MEGVVFVPADTLNIFASIERNVNDFTWARTNNKCS